LTCLYFCCWGSAQVLEYTATDADTLHTLGECLISYKQWQLAADGTSADTYRVPDERDSAAIAQVSQWSGLSAAGSAPPLPGGGTRVM
jgi:hypothetical protein